MDRKVEEEGCNFGANYQVIFDLWIAIKRHVKLPGSTPHVCLDD